MYLFYKRILVRSILLYLKFHFIHDVFQLQSCLTVFKSLSTLEKTVEKCRLSLDLEANRLIFQLCCKHGLLSFFM